MVSQTEAAADQQQLPEDELQPGSSSQHLAVMSASSSRTVLPPARNLDPAREWFSQPCMLGVGEILMPDQHMQHRLLELRAAGHTAFDFYVVASS